MEDSFENRAPGASESSAARYVRTRAASICTRMSAIWNAIASCSASLRPKVSRVFAYSTEAS